MISNFEDLHGRLDRTPSPALFISSRKYGRDLGIVVCGQESALTKPAIVQIKRMFWSAGDDPARMRERLARINAFAAASKIAKGTISPNCSVFSIRRDGTGRYDFNGALELKSLMSGTPIPDLRKLLKNIGYGDAKLIAAVSASSGPKLPYAPCKPIAVWPEGSEHYQILEVQDPRFSSLRAMAVNDTGVVAGDGVSTIAAGNTRPWRASTDRIMEAPDIVAHATAIDAIGAVALKTTMSDKSVHAAIWDTNSITDLGVYLGKSSGATAAAQGLIAGWVCIDPINQGQRNFRPAAWTDGKMFIQQQLPCDWGQAVAATECGKVLVLGYYGKSPAGFLWEPKIGKLAILGTKIGIYPVSLSRNGTVLGFAREAGESVAYKIESGSDWEPVGCAPGLYPTAINDVGDIVGSATGDGFDRPWLRYATGEVIWLPYFRGHWCRPNALNNHGTIVGNAASDHGSHALLWIPSGKR
jgi:hypothetical protein